MKTMINITIIISILFAFFLIMIRETMILNSKINQLNGVELNKMEQVNQ